MAFSVKNRDAADVAIRGMVDVGDAAKREHVADAFIEDDSNVARLEIAFDAKPLSLMPELRGKFADKTLPKEVERGVDHVVALEEASVAEVGGGEIPGRSASNEV